MGNRSERPDRGDRPQFPEVPGGYPFPALEREVLAEWQRQRIFEQTVTRPGPLGDFVFFEGPPTANNVPHVGHVVPRLVKDLFPRYRTMRGYRVPRKAGWDTHGLPVEIEVEKRLGFSGKRQIEEYGIAEFNRECLASVRTYERQWRAMTERIGYWTDLDHAYYTYSNEYVESVWWALAELWKQGLLVESYKIQPYCGRCGTTLSSHEVAQNYKETEDPSIWTLFPAREGQRLTAIDGSSWEVGPDLEMVAWTTTPWTTLANVGLAVHPDLIYRVVAHPSHPGIHLLFGDDLANPVPAMAQVGEVSEVGEISEVGAVGGAGEVRTVRRQIDLRTLPALARFRGRDLEGLLYERPFGFFAGDQPGKVVLGDYVSADEGTGLVHTAPPFGEDDYQTGLRYGLPLLLTVEADGKIAAGAGPFAGLWFKDADPLIVRDLQGRGLLLHSGRYRHNYPFCWRCDRPLLYYATRSWFVKTTEAKAALIAHNREIHWHPESVGEGRFGNWLENVVDWALSRSRYWGTPLPIWICECGHRQAIGSYAELFAAAARQPPEDVYDREQFDPHRPFIDEPAFRFRCPVCGGDMTRVPYVIDAWFDSGAMPFAQHHYPFENRELIDGRLQFPADLIAEGIDQTRGWFYTLHVLATLLFDSVAYRTCIVTGHVNDEQGRKMSKRLGNVVDPMAVIEETGADALRWYFCVNNPEVASRFSARLVRDAAQRFLLPLWNALSFFTIYANLDGWRPRAGNPSSARDADPGSGPAALPFAARPALDRWVLLRLDRLVAATTDHLEGYRVAEAARGIDEFLDDLTNWYIRRSRGRFWAPSRSDEIGDVSEVNEVNEIDEAPPEADRKGRPGDESVPAVAGGQDKASAYEALYEALTTLARLLAPFVPFLAELLHRQLVRSQHPAAPASVHLEPWPEAPAGRLDDALEAGMAAVLRIVRLGHAARNAHGLKTRQPLPSVTIVTADPALRGALQPDPGDGPGEGDAGGGPDGGSPESKETPFLGLLRDELNVHQVLWAADRSHYVRHEVVPIFPKTGPRFGKRMPEVKRALAAADGDALAAQLESSGTLTLQLAGGPVELAADEVEVRLVEKEGTATQGDRDLLVVLDTRLTPELVAEGQARELVHWVQALRKDRGLDYADRIRIKYLAGSAVDKVVDAHREWIQRETLAVAIEPVKSPPELDDEGNHWLGSHAPFDLGHGLVGQLRLAKAEPSPANPVP
jgi:isoleucyl-tRNA synthetase